VKAAAALLLAGVVAGVAPARADARWRSTFHGRHASIVLDGVEVPVVWSDGDTFRPKGAKHPARVSGYNTLETYGAVHRWGGWDPAALEALANRATVVASSRTRTCHSLGKPDSYGRTLVDCPDAAADLLGQGLAMVFAVAPETPDAKLLAVQAAAQRARRGIWADGVPELILTSVHSADEPTARPGPHGPRAYNRVVDPKTGMTEMREHDRVLATCENVCEVSGKTKTCLVYVPFEHRYKNKPPCLLAAAPAAP
jgi:micrococcal nuclease